MGREYFKRSKFVTILGRCLVFKDLILRWYRWWCHFIVLRFNLDEKDAKNPCEFG